MQTKITGSANGEISATDARVWHRWVSVIGGYVATAVKGCAHIDSRHLSLDDAWRSARVCGSTLFVVEPSEPAERLGQVREGRVLAGFWP